MRFIFDAVRLLFRQSPIASGVGDVVVAEDRHDLACAGAVFADGHSPKFLARTEMGRLLSRSRICGYAPGERSQRLSNPNCNFQRSWKRRQGHNGGWQARNAVTSRKAHHAAR
jgi:hypothetical protein